MAFMTPSSYGEALDRLTILQLKLDNIQDEKRRKDVKQEYDDLWDLVKDLVKKDKFHYDKLLEANRTMWVIQDILHEGKANDIGHEYNLMKQLAVENQRRFRIKRTLNENLGSKHREQKGYKGKRAFVLSHLGMGDHFFMNGAVRWLATYFDEVTVVVKEQYLENLKILYSNEPSVNFHIIEKDSDISPLFGCPLETFKKAIEGYEFVGLNGFHRDIKPPTNFPLSFYDELGISQKILMEWSMFPDTSSESIKQEYIFYHNKSSNITANISINKDEYLVINPTENMYSEGHKWYGEAQKWVGRPILDYVNVLKGSKKQYMIDSSFFCMAVLLGLTPEVWTRNGRSYKNLIPQLVEHAA